MLKEELDVLMLLFEESEADFHKAYKNASWIVDYNGRGRSRGDELPFHLLHRFNELTPI